MKKTRTRIFLERRKVKVVRFSVEEQETFCERCAHPASMISATAAAARIGVDVRAIYSEVARQTVHFAETADGLLLICSESVSERFSQPARSSAFASSVDRTD